ncbi:MAG: Dna2/Cas4 domain-containing protein [Methanobrevibacter sp.]|jgi:CRISPR-associated exonuclease Cas4|nr:Dna2/Cas4 domain-containing protein [Candidatus Methanoflexus mossambicus]
MIGISSIQEYMFCPLKLFLRDNLEENFEDKIFVKKAIKRIRLDVMDLLHRNIRGLNKQMDLGEIKEYLTRNIKHIVKESLNLIEQRNDVLSEEFNEIKDELLNEIDFEIDLLALKSYKAMQSLDKDGGDISEMFFPSAMYNYLIKDKTLEIIGSCDKIEIIEGRYFPIDFKNSIPPYQGVWDGDAIKLAANAILIEQEFDTEVFVGYIDYLKLGERRQVVMDSKIRKSLFKILHEVKEIIFEGQIPDVTPNLSKCSKCEYCEICNESSKVDDNDLD